MSHLAELVAKQRRFRLLFVGLMVLSVVLGLMVIPVEANASHQNIKNWQDGLWWSAITVTGVGYGDRFPVTFTGRLIGLILACVGVLAYGLIISFFSNALNETKDHYYRQKLFESLNEINGRLDKLERHESYMVKKTIPESKSPPQNKAS